MSRLAPALLALVLSACATCDAADDEEGSSPVEETLAGEDLRAAIVGRYRATLASPGGELPFFLEIHEAGAEPPAEAINGEERAALSAVVAEGEALRLEIAHYEAVITATRGASGALRGLWRRENREGHSELPFSAVPIRDDASRFSDPADRPGADAVDGVSGVWRVTFTDDDGPFPARGELVQDGGRVTGTFLTATGDYRFLAGDFDRGVLRLSTFDGFNAYLFVARVTDEGSLSGDFWSRDSYHATLEATRPRPDDEAILPDPFGEVRVTSADQKLRFDFPTPDGARVALPSPELDGHPVIVSIFGTWCPNCNDEAAVLSDFDARYRDRGLRIVGLAFEHSADPEVAEPRLSRFAGRHGIEFPLALAGRSVKSETSAALPDLSEIASYPTTIFVGADGRVRRIHSGFAGPATGAQHRELVAEMEGIVESLLEEADRADEAGSERP